MKRINNEKAITLIALIITIIILLILAGITISALAGSGLLKNANLAQVKSEEAQEKENITLEEHGQKIDKYLGTENDENQEQPPQEEPPKSAPIITITQGETTSNSITIDISIVDEDNVIPENATYNYYIKKSNEEDYEGEAKHTGRDTNYLFEGLTQGTEYDIKITIEDADKKVIAQKIEKNISTVKTQHIDTLEFPKTYTYYLYYKTYNGLEWLSLSNEKMHAMKHYCDDSTQAYFQMPCYYRPVQTPSGAHYRYTEGVGWEERNSSNIIKNITLKGESPSTEWSWFENSAFEYIYCNYDVNLYNNNTAGIISDYKTIKLEDIGLLQ